MANPNRVVGQSKIKIDGTSYPSAGKSTLEIGGPARTPVKGDYDAGSFSETTEPSKLDVSLLYKAGVSLADLRSIDNATVLHELDTGVTWIIRNAYVAEVISYDTSSGEAKLVIQGPPAEEMM